jgi:4-amino-4-deoxy-L-arabinose transferase-like glycosyltransferase
MTASQRILNSAVYRRFLRIASSPFLICAVAFILRLGFLLDQAHNIPAEALATVPFQNEVGNIAASLAAGNGFCCLFRQPTGPTAWLAPIYPLLVAMLFKMFGVFTAKSFYAAALMNSMFSAAVCLPLYSIGKRIGGIAVATAAAWIWVFFPSGILMPFEWIWDTSLSALLAATLLWATLEVADRRSLRNALLYGLLWGAALLTNPIFGILLPFLFGWVLYRQRREQRAGLKYAFLSVLVVAACCAPWTIRNALQFHRLIPLRSNFAFELWLGNNEVFDQRSRELNRITRFEQVRRYGQLGESDFLEEKRREVANFLRTHPGLALSLAGRRVIATWLGTETPWLDFRRSDSALVRFLFLWNLVSLIGAIVGLVRLFAKNSFFFPVAAFPLVFPSIYYVTHTSMRYRHPCDPVLALLLAIAVLGAGADDAGAELAVEGSKANSRNGKFGVSDHKSPPI